MIVNHQLPVWSFCPLVAPRGHIDTILLPKSSKKQEKQGPDARPRLKNTLTRKPRILEKL